MHLPSRLLGLFLLGAAYLPAHRLLSVASTGPAGAATREAAETTWAVGLSGTLIVLALAWVLSRMTADRVGEFAVPRRWLAWILDIPAATFAVGIAAATTVLCGLIAARILRGEPTSVDEMAQLLNARALAAGSGSIPVPGDPAAWVIQNGVVTARGWVSIYPPFHTALLALGVLTGVPWAIGPVLTGVASGASTWVAERLLGARIGRLTGGLFVLSPFWLLLGATYSSHAAAVAALALLALALVRARESDQTRWYLVAGLAGGAAISARPWIALACGAAIVACLLVRRPESAGTGRAWRLGAFILGGAPFAALLFGWNLRYFGHPLRLGYSAAFGPAHGLGLHIDPWGNRYGLVEAVGYTGADLMQLGVRLFESPLPALAVVGAVLLVRPIPRGAVVFVAWAATAVGANAVYWHHGIHFGPRMLFEAVPAMVVLFAWAATEILGQPGHPRGGARYASWTVVTSLVAGLLLAPSAVRAPAVASARSLPAPPEPGAVVFLHGTWASRIASRLAATGMRRDSIETALRRNDICAVDRYARWRRGEVDAGAPASLDFEPLPGTPSHLETRTLSPGNRIRVDPGVPPDAPCVREAHADRLGVSELETMAWRLPIIGTAGPVVARDLGPGSNLRVIEALGRPAYLYLDGADGSGLLLDYGPGMELIWGGAAGEVDRD